MRSLLDALLSVQKYVADTLGSEWDVRLATGRGEVVADHPLALVVKVGDAAPSGGSALYTEVVQPMAVHCYPLPQATAEGSIVAATIVEERLQLAFRYEGIGLGHPLRLPLFDYDGVEDVSLGDSTVRNAHDYLRIDGFSTSQVAEPQDPRKIRVIVAFTARWRRTGKVPSGRTAVSVIVGGSASTP